MTLQVAANRTDVLEGSGIYGWENTLTKVQPDRYGTVTSGNGVVRFVSDGCRLEPGGTSGDTAHLTSVFDSGAQRVNAVVQVILYRIFNNTSPTNDDFEIGFCGDNPNDSTGKIGGILDLTTSEYRVSTNTLSATVPSTGNMAFLIIKRDNINNETTFHHFNSAFDETKTISAIETGRNRLAVGESNGNDDKIDIRYHRYFYTSDETFPI